MKAAVKSGRAQGAKIVPRVIEAAEADAWAEKVEEMKDEIEEVLEEEKEDKLLAQTEMEVKKGENMIVSAALFRHLFYGTKNLCWSSPLTSYL